MKHQYCDTGQLPVALSSRLLRAGQQQCKGTESFSEHAKQFTSHGYTSVLLGRNAAASRRAAGHLRPASSQA